MSEVDELWNWIGPPLLALRQRRHREPTTAWHEHFAEFLRELNIAEADQHPVTRSLRDRLDAIPDAGDRDRLVESDEFERIAYRIIEDAVGGGYDEAAWHAFAATNLPHWNGAAESWREFAEWFVYWAAAAGLAVPATAFMEHAGPMSNDDRIALFAQYGVTVRPAAPQVALDAATEAAMAELLAADARFAGIPEARRRELAAEVLREHAAR